MIQTLAIALTLALAPAISKDEKDVRALLDGQVGAWNRKDLDGFLAGYWKSDQLSFYAGGVVTMGWQQTFDRYKKRYTGEGKEMGTLAFNDLTIEILSPKLAFARGKWQLTMSQGLIQRGLFTLVLKKLPEGWRIVHDHSSQ